MRNANAEARALGWASAHDYQNTIRDHDHKGIEARSRYARPVRRGVRLPNGRVIGLRAYANAWRGLIQLERDGKNPTIPAPSWNGWGAPAMDVLAEMRGAMQDRINSLIPGFGRGRKWDSRWQAETSRAARELNTPRLRIYWLPHDLRSRFAHRIATRED